MSSSWKRPFSDLEPLYRLVQASLAAPAPSAAASGETVRKLLRRRDPKDIAEVPTMATGRKTLVSSTHVVARRVSARTDPVFGVQPGGAAADGQWKQDTRSELESVGFVRQELPLGDTYAELADRLELYELPADSPGGAAVDGGTGTPDPGEPLGRTNLPPGVAAGHVYFSLLQAGPESAPPMDPDEAPPASAGNDAAGAAHPPGSSGGDSAGAALGAAADGGGANAGGAGGAHAGGGGSGDVVVKAPGGPTKVQLASAESQALPSKPKGIKVAVIDTGIARSARAHPMLEGIERRENGNSNIDELDRLPAGQLGLLDFGAGHGTFAAGVIRQVDPDADIMVYRALDTDGLGDDIAVARAIIDAWKGEAMVINLSLGTHTVDGQPPVAIQAALDTVRDGTTEANRPVFVAAAGNAGTEQLVYPAACDDVVAVAALTLTGPAPWSSHGDWVKFSTIGENIVAPFVAGKEDPHLDNTGTDGITFAAGDWGMWTGTSFAAPQITGAISRICFKENVSPTEALAMLPDYGELKDATPLSGYGLPMRILPAG